MKDTGFYPVILCAALVFSAIAATAGSDEIFSDISLRGIKEVVPYVSVYMASGQPCQRLAEDVEAYAANILEESQIKAEISEPNEAMTGRTDSALKAKWRSIEIPELVIRIYAIQHEPTQSCVFNVQTSLARKVYTSQSVRSAAKAEVWRIDVTPTAVDANNFEVVLKKAVEIQIRRFIEELKKANSGRAVINEKDYRTQRPAQTPRESKTIEQSSEQGQYQYISSKNSPVFHKTTCSSAERISSDNLVTYKSREEAIQSVKRPCKTCKP